MIGEIGLTLEDCKVSGSMSFCIRRIIVLEIKIELVRLFVGLAEMSKMP